MADGKERILYFNWLNQYNSQLLVKMQLYAADLNR